MGESKSIPRLPSRYLMSSSKRANRRSALTSKPKILLLVVVASPAVILPAILLSSRHTLVASAYVPPPPRACSWCEKANNQLLPSPPYRSPCSPTKAARTRTDTTSTVWRSGGGGGIMLASSTAKGGPAAAIRIPAAFGRLRSDPNATLVLDGGTGEELFRRGVPDDRKIWSATAVVNPQYHDALREVHRSFVRAGAGAVTTNSYGITPGVGFTDEDIARHVATSGRLAREAIDGMKGDDDGDGGVLVLGSLGPLLESYRPDRLLPHDRGVSVYHLMARALSPYVDCYLAETMSSVEEASQAVKGVGRWLREQREGGGDGGGDSEHPMMCSYTLRGDGRLRSGQSAPEGVRGAVDACRRHGVALVGVLFNCCEPEAITSALGDIRADEELQGVLSGKPGGGGDGDGDGVPLGAYANRLTAIATDWSLEGSDEPQAMRKDLAPGEYYDDFVRSWVTDLGVQMVGGCCGMTPEHIDHISAHLGGAGGQVEDA